ncbi:UNVERIFIED_CONTAM: hypothetical protein FKN15_011700 [Acipenser sinensis]
MEKLSVYAFPSDSDAFLPPTPPPVCLCQAFHSSSRSVTAPAPSANLASTRRSARQERGSKCGSASQPPPQLHYKDWTTPKLLKILFEKSIPIPVGGDRMSLFLTYCEALSAEPIFPPRLQASAVRPSSPATFSVPVPAAHTQDPALAAQLSLPAQSTQPQHLPQSSQFLFLLRIRKILLSQPSFPCQRSQRSHSICRSHSPRPSPPPAAPLRLQELNQYLFLVVELAVRYGGALFYQYHRAFSAKAAATLSADNRIIDWSRSDTDLFTRIFSGIRPNACSACASTAHSSYLCPKTAASSLQPIHHPLPSLLSPRHLAPASIHASAPPTRSQARDVYGRPIKFTGGRQICNNFNTSACFSKPASTFMPAASATTPTHAPYVLFQRSDNQSYFKFLLLSSSRLSLMRSKIIQISCPSLI